MVRTLTQPSQLEHPIVVPWRSGPFPRNWADDFGRNGPLLLEIGFGNGVFTTQLAQQRPDLNIVGLEVATSSLVRTKKSVQNAAIPNIRLMKVDAFFGIQHLFGPETLDTIIVNFPDPWPKEKHTKHRLLQDRFYQVAATRLVPGGEIRLATDHPEYLSFAEEEARASGVFEVTSPEPPELAFNTKYAKRWKEEGKPLFYRVFVKTGTPTESYPPLQRSETMPHATLTGPQPTLPSFDKLVARTGNAADTVIVHEAATVDSPKTRVLFRVSVDEQDLHQQVLVVLQEREQDEYIVRLEPFGDPVITPAVRAAIGTVTDWLEEEAGLSVTARHY